ncbi:hypothetical protein U3516DRAFT_745742 [Neocallimastix sp. 'constans']
MVYPDYCLGIEDINTGTQYNNDGLFELIGKIDKCIAKTDVEKFYNWDHNPISSTVCFSEAFSYPCCSDPYTTVITIDNYGRPSITLASCDYITYSLGDILYMYNDHFHLKFNEKHGLMVVDDISLIK